MPVTWPLTVSQTRIVPAIMWLHAVAVQSVEVWPPGLPGVPLKISYGRTNDCVSPVQPPLALSQRPDCAVPVQLAMPAVQCVTPPLLPPCQMTVPTGSMRAKKPSPPVPICHCAGPVGVPFEIAELDPLSCAPPFAYGFAEVRKLPLMSPE